MLVSIPPLLFSLPLSFPPSLPQNSDECSRVNGIRSTSRLGHRIPRRVNPQVTRTQINSAPPNPPQSSLVTACWTGGSSLALISPASVLHQAAIFHVLKTDDPRVREMKAPFNRSARDSPGKEGEGPPSSSVLARTGPEHVLQRPGSGLRNGISSTISPRLCPP